MDRSVVEELGTDELRDALARSEHADLWLRLVDVAGGEAASVLRLVCRVDPPERIRDLRGLEAEQSERGAGFLGMLPDQIPDDLGVPTDLEASLDVAIRLVQIRAKNLAALTATMPDYPLSFAGHRFDPDAGEGVPADWRLDIDIDGIRAVLDYFDAEEPDANAATSIARMPAFAEMIRHRRELGYVPEPLIDETGLAWCLVRAASRDPIDELWKWLHPQNLFDLSDLYAYRAEYRRLIDDLARRDGLADHILGRIAPYAPRGTSFQDRLSFAVGWGIRGWATQKTGGMNIEHAKDDFDRMLPTLVHETFHRLQTEVALPNPQIDEAGFDRITSYPLDSEGDRRLYRALCYVMLEGSATYVQSPVLTEAWSADAKAGVEILDRIRGIGTSEDAPDKSDELLNEGLRSNGPFYGFGALLSHAFVEEGGPSSLGAALQRGAPAFVEDGLILLGDSATPRPEALASHIARLRSPLEA